MQIDVLTSWLPGRVITPGDDAWEAARHFHSGTGEPDVIVRADSVADVVAAVRWAASEAVPIVVRSGDVEHTYEVVRTRETSFRSPRSLAAQRAPVPGRPGVEPTEAMLTLSTCATPEDHAAGNYWKDEFDNPEHRIDKIAVLRSSRSVG